MNNIDPDIQKEIFNAIRGNTGLSLEDIRKRTGYSRPTVTKNVHILEAKKKVKLDRSRPPYVLVERV